MEHQDFSISVSYHVYTCDEHGKILRHVGNYPCMCVVKEVAQYLNDNYGVTTKYLKRIEED